MESWINPSHFGESINERKNMNRLFVITRQCRFCHQYFHELYVGHENFREFDEIKSTLEPLVTYPVSRTKFEAKQVPKEITNAFNEAERCRSVGSLTGAGGCLRKTVYALCDSQKVTGKDYREKIGKLPVKETYQELLKQIKWLGDNTTKPGEEKYTMEMIDVAFEILPVLVDDMYLKEEKTDAAAKLLAKARSANNSVKD
ncbi:MAG: hypothetical protein WEA04_04610 [Candidatus Andersenbacteria bacterium]